LVGSTAGALVGGAAVGAAVGVVHAASAANTTINIANSKNFFIGNSPPWKM
jgi:hypothetical protein